MKELHQQLTESVINTGRAVFKETPLISQLGHSCPDDDDDDDDNDDEWKMCKTNGRGALATKKLMV